LDCTERVECSTEIIRNTAGAVVYGMPQQALGGAAILLALLAVTVVQQDRDRLRVADGRVGWLALTFVKPFL